LPFCRTHSSLKGDQEPWSFGPSVEEIARTALARRYRLLPYFYTAFHEAATRGLPVVRPLFFADPTDAALRAEDHAFLLGGDLMVQPQLMNAPGHDFAMPKGRWRTLSLCGADPGVESAHPRLRVRDGAILPVGRGGQMVAEAFSGPLTLFVSLDASGRARGRLYEDAGEGFGYLDGDYLLTTYEARRMGTEVEVSVVRQEGRRPRARRALRIVLLTDEGERRAQGFDGDAVLLPLDA
jgi:alpha-glucosidase